MLYLPTATRTEMEFEILNNEVLFFLFDEKKLLDGGYSDDEYRTVIQRWIEDGDECSAA